MAQYKENCCGVCDAGLELERKQAARVGWSKLERLEAKMKANLDETERQLQFVGMRLGVTIKLATLERERDRIAEQIERLKEKDNGK